MDLSEFLLARIAEDEEVARADDRHWSEVPHALFGARRVLVDCKSKRQIVEQVSDTAWASYAVRDFVLGELALPYADHPDYDPAWRP